MKKVESYEHACEILQKDPAAKPELSMLPEKDQKAFMSLFLLTVIISAQNKLNGWVADWSDDDQEKYFPVFWVKEKPAVSGLGLSFDFDLCGYLNAAVSSRLSVGSSEEAEYIGETFTSLYEDWMLI